MSVTVIHEKCDLKVADNKELPYSAYIIQYEHEGTTHHDVAVGDKAVDIFDHYFHYSSTFITPKKIIKYKLHRVHNILNVNIA